MFHLLYTVWGTMSHFSQAPGYQSGLFQTQRKDAWWLQPLAIFLGLSAFGIYSTWAALQGAHYQFGPYLSPFYSPLILVDWWKWSPSFLILWAPLGFRATCYYYRKAYYRSFFADPPACAVGEIAEHQYRGETALPFIVQNVHRYFLIFAVALLFFLWHDVYQAFWFDGNFGIGLGTVVLFFNSLFLSFYTLGCHSLRHFVGGRLNSFSCGFAGDACFKAWMGVSCLNAKHMLWAWISLFTVGFADLYVRLCAMGMWQDIRII